MPEKLARKGAIWHDQNSNISPRKIAANGALHIIDNSRASTERIAQFFQHNVTETFLSSAMNGLASC
jgi:hypothetical protein